MNKDYYERNYLFLISDLLSMVISYFLSFELRFNSLTLYHDTNYVRLLLIYLFINVSYNTIYYQYKDILSRGYIKELMNVVTNSLISLLSIVLVFFCIKQGEYFSRLFILYFHIVFVAISYFFRNIIKIIVKKKLDNNLIIGDKSLLVICSNDEVFELLTNLKEIFFGHYFISGICIFDKDKKGEKINQFNIVCNSKEILDYISRNWIDLIYIGKCYRKLPERVLKGLLDSNIPLNIHYDEFEESNCNLKKIGNHKILQVNKKERMVYEIIIKKSVDIIGAFIGCAFTILLMLILGPIIYIKSPGNIFYSSTRIGKNGKPFKFYKFRSMIMNADDQKEKLMNNNRNKDGMMFKIDNDPRIIPGIGEFIRRTSLDEFPQFFNVLKGDMSLVGTRPPTLDEWVKYTPYYRSRLSIKPGITGLWQVSGRSDITNFNDVVKLDNEYINNWSLSLDLKILIKTVFVVLKQRGSM